MATTPQSRPMNVYKQDVAHLFLENLKANGVNFAVLIPDTILYALDELLMDDPDIETMVCSREDEGFAIAMGACYGGKKPVVLMEGSGLGLSPLILARALLQRNPILILSGHNSVYGERYSYHGATRLVTQPTLDMLRIPYHVLRAASEIPWVLRELSDTMAGQKLPAAVLVPRHIAIED
ncbi:MAG TPA: thiamine pyrophosphate-binding protein [Chloroflexota bacterium]|jgi:sulfopyruvate decarboxylase TPP-binding subunit